MAQPDPAPIAKSRQFGGMALAATYLAVALLPLALALGRQVVPLDPWERLGAGVGLVALTAMAVQFVTSGRFGIVSGRLGIDQIMGFHKIAAWWVLLGLLLHPLFYVLPTWADDPARGLLRLHAYVTLPHYRSGVVSLAALALLVLTSSLRERLPLTYEMWRASHVVLAITAAATGLHHAVTVGRFSALGAVHAWWWGVAGALALVMATLYGWRWLALHRYPWRLQAVEKRADRIWELDIQPAQGTPDLRFDAGQFVWMTVGAKRFPLFDHPFSIASAPAQPGLSLIIKEAGDFTGQIGTLAPGTPVGIDGPYGEFSLDNHSACAVVLVAGGAGIGPIMGLLRELVLREDKRPIRLAYAVGQKDNFACLDEIEQAQSVLDLQIMLLCEQDDDGFDGEIGHLDHKRLAQVTEGLDKSRTVAMMCGPGPMLVAVSDMLLDIGLDMTRIVYERFDYASGATSRQDRKRMAQLLSVGAGLVAGLGVFMAVALR